MGGAFTCFANERQEQPSTPAATTLRHRQQNLRHEFFHIQVPGLALQPDGIDSFFPPLLLFFSMPLFSETRDVDDPVRYTAVANEAADVDEPSHLETEIASHDTEVNRSSVDLSADTNSSSFKQDKTSIDQCTQSAALLSTPPDTACHKARKINGWPTAPSRLSGFSVPLFVGDVVLILLPVAFLALGISAWLLDKKGLSKNGSIVESAIRFGPTVYPLAFAAIGSRCFRNLAVCLAERGTTIATLERLLGSQSLVSAIGIAISLRSINLLSLSIVSLWILSPLGGQSSLRLLQHANTTVSEAGIVYYSDHNAPFNPDEFTKDIALAPAIVTASLFSSQEAKDLPVDLWSHPKIPRVDVIEQLSLNRSVVEGEWISVDTTEQQYSSWAGVNVQNVRKTGSGAFQIKYSYIHLNCEVLFNGTAFEVWQDMLAAKLTMYPSVPTIVSNDTSKASAALRTLRSSGAELAMFLRITSVSDVPAKPQNDTTSGFGARNQSISYLYGTDSSVYPNFKVHTCVPHVVWLDAQILCESGNCAAVKLRYTPRPSRATLEASCSRSYTIGCLEFGTMALPVFIRYLPQALMSPIYESYNAFNQHIMDPKPDPHNSNATFDEILSKRLTIIMNTFYQAVAWGPQITSADLFEEPKFPHQEPPILIAPERWLNTTNATFSQTVFIYKANVSWIATLLLITTILLLLSIVNIAISFMTVAPDLFSYASSLARENPYTDTPDGGTALDGRERSRLLRTMKVQIADVSPHSQVGYVVLKSVGSGDDLETGRLKKDRAYW